MLEKIGVVYEFTAKGMEALSNVSKGLSELNASADAFTRSAGGMTEAVGGMASAFTTLMYPLYKLQDAFRSTGGELENLYIQIQSLSGYSTKEADAFMGNLQRLSQDIPYSWMEIGNSMREFKFMGLDVTKDYGDMTVNILGHTETLKKSLITGLSGMAASTGRGLAEVTHSVENAIVQGQSQWLNLYFGPLRVQQMQMAGIFTGTWQQQIDKLAPYISERFSQAGLLMSRSWSGIANNMGDTMRMVMTQVFGFGSSDGGWITELRYGLSALVKEIQNFVTSGGMVNGIAVSMKDLGKVISEGMMPTVKEVLSLLRTGWEKLQQGILWVIQNKEIVSFWINIYGKITLGVGAVVAFAAAVRGLMWTFTALMGLFNPWVVALEALLAGWAVAYKFNFLNIREVTSEGLNWIVEKFKWFSNFLTVLWETISTVNKEGFFMVSKKAWEGLGAGAQDFIYGVAKAGMYIHKGEMGKALTSGLFGDFGPSLQNLWETMKKLGKVLRDDFEACKPVLKDLGETLGEALKDGIGGFIELVNLTAKLVMLIREFTGWTAGKMGSIYQGLDNIAWRNKGTVLGEMAENTKAQTSNPLNYIMPWTIPLHIAATAADRHVAQATAGQTPAPGVTNHYHVGTIALTPSAGTNYQDIFEQLHRRAALLHAQSGGTVSGG